MEGQSTRCLLKRSRKVRPGHVQLMLVLLEQDLDVGLNDLLVEAA
jgi:hypothetical protein